MGDCCKIVEILSLKMPVSESLYCNNLIVRDSESSHHLWQLAQRGGAGLDLKGFRGGRAGLGQC